jgi:hypothetical protein
MQTTAALVAEWIVLIFIAGIGGIVLVKLWMGTIDLSGLLSEPSGGSTAVANAPAADSAQGGGSGGAGAGGGAVAARPGGGAAAVAPAGGVAAVATPAAGPGKPACRDCSCCCSPSSSPAFT